MLHNRGVWKNINSAQPGAVPDIGNTVIEVKFPVFKVCRWAHMFGALRSHYDRKCTELHGSPELGQEWGQTSQKYHLSYILKNQ